MTQRDKLKEHLPSLYARIAKDKKWGKRTIDGHNVQYNKILSFFGEMAAQNVTLFTINTFINKVCGENEVGKYNRYVFILKSLFGYAASRSIMPNNPTKNLIRRTERQKDEDEYHRLNEKHFHLIYNLAEKKDLGWMLTAMNLAKQTSCGVHEVAHVKYTDISPAPYLRTGAPMDHMYIHRQKTKHTKASRIAIPISESLKAIVSNSRQDNVLSPFIVHRQRSKRYRGRPLGEGIEHETQIAPVDISRKFSDLRDELHLFDDIPDRRIRPSFHDIRSLSISWQEDNGIDAQKRAAHSKRETTEGYRRGHKSWVMLENIEINY